MRERLLYVAAPTRDIRGDGLLNSYVPAVLKVEISSKVSRE